MVKAWVLAAAFVVAPVVASAQPAPRASDDETIRARQKISLIEGLFERAVQNGVDNISRHLQAVSPNADGMAMLMGAPLVRGFRTTGGIFFDVQMPSLQLSMVWPLRYAQGADAAATASLAELRTDVSQLTDPQTRQQFTQKIRQIEMALQASSPRRRPTLGATAVANVEPTAAAAPPPPVSPADMAILDDPAEAWRAEVRGTLIDAMIENTGGVSVGPDEYIEVQARGVLSPDRLVANAGDARTIRLRLKGSDLTAYRAGTITLEEARTRVIVSEY